MFGGAELIEPVEPVRESEIEVEQALDSALEMPDGPGAVCPLAGLEGVVRVVFLFVVAAVVWVVVTVPPS